MASTESVLKVAVLGFKGMGGEAGLSDEFLNWEGYFTSVLSGVPGVGLVERARLEKIFHEQKLQAGGAVAPRAAVNIGRLSGADYVFSGNYRAEKGRVRIYAKLMDSTSGMIVLAKSTETAVQDLGQARADLSAGLAADFIGAVFKFNKKMQRASAGKRRADVDLISRSYDAYARRDYHEGIRLLKASVGANPSAEGYDGLGEMYGKVGGLENSQQAYGKAADLYLAAGNKRDAANSLLKMGVALRERRKFQAARDVMSRALDIGLQIKDKTIEAGAHGNIGGVYLLENDLENAETHLSAAEKIAKRLGLPDLAASVNSNLGMVYRNRGEYEKAIPIALNSLAVFKTELNRKNVLTGYLALGDIYNYLGDHETALKYLLEGITYSLREPERDATEGRLQWKAGSTYRALGKIQNASRCLSKGVEYLENKEDWRGLASAAWETADLLWKNERYSAAAAYQDKSIKAVERMGLKDLEARDIYLVGAFVSANADMTEKAADLMERAIGLDELNGYPELAKHMELLKEISNGSRRFNYGDFSALFKPRLAIMDMPVSGNGPLASSLRTLPDKLIIELHGSPDLVLVEREKLGTVLKEAVFGASGHVDPDAAAAFGKLLGANSMVVGNSFVAGDTAEIAVQVIDVESGRILGGIIQKDVRIENLEGAVKLLGAKVLRIMKFSSGA